MGYSGSGAVGVKGGLLQGRVRGADRIVCKLYNCRAHSKRDDTLFRVLTALDRGDTCGMR